jgi:hypothetical protein
MHQKAGYRGVLLRRPRPREMKYRMHILDDLDGLSARARDLLSRTGRREPLPDSRLATEFLQVRDRSGRLVPAPAMLAIRREGFEQRYGGLRYQVRDSYTHEGERHEVSFSWRYDLEQDVWADSARGWYFSWFGEHAATPVRWLVHTDGRAGVDDGGGKFLEIAPSIPALIESHALTDMVAAWDRTPLKLKVDGFALARQVDGLTDIPEASGPTIRWRVSDTIAVQEFRNWSSQEPTRRWRAFIWTRGADGQRQIEQATSSSASPWTGSPLPRYRTPVHDGLHTGSRLPAVAVRLTVPANWVLLRPSR